MVYIDPPFKIDAEVFPNAPKVFIGKDSAHLTADTLQELKVYAKSIGIPLNWLQSKNGYAFHIDVTGRFLASVLLDNAVCKITRQEYGERLIQKRDVWQKRSKI